MRILKRWPYVAVLLALMAGPAGDIAVAGNKLFVGGLSWDTTDALLVIPLAVHQRFVQRDDYFIVTQVLIADQDGNLLAEVASTPHPIVPVGTGRNEDGLAEIAPQSIPWDRRGGSYTGIAGVGVIVQIFDRRGQPVHKADAEAFAYVEIR